MFSFLFISFSFLGTTSSIFTVHILQHIKRYHMHTKKSPVYLSILWQSFARCSLILLISLLTLFCCPPFHNISHFLPSSKHKKEQIDAEYDEPDSVKPKHLSAARQQRKEAQQRGNAIAAYKRMEKRLDECERCLNGTRYCRWRTIAIGEYASVPFSCAFFAVTMHYLLCSECVLPTLSFAV